MGAESHTTGLDGIEVLVPDVGPADIAHLAEVIRGQGGTITGERSGIVENDCFAAKFRYDRHNGLLTLEPFRLMPGLTPRRLRRTVEHLISPPPASKTLDSGETIYMPQPHSCATYNWAIGYFENKTGFELKYSGSTTEAGYLQTDMVANIPDGTTPSDHKDGFWTNKGGKDSVAGCFGHIEYQLDEGLATLKVYYGVNTRWTMTAHAAISGPNHDRYNATWKLHDSFGGAAAYIYPYVTIGLA